MLILRSIAEVREQVLQWRNLGQRQALVPMMGNLHKGHFKLIEHAQRVAGKTSASIFVNPIQFNNKEDFINYPRSEASDLQALERLGVDLAFVPNAEQMQTSDLTEGVSLIAGALSRDLCGAFRPGHFDGVATIVAKLFNIFQPDIAVFGEKDYQQLCIVRQLVRNLSLDIKILSVETVRSADGLALSSRNSYLSEEERTRAPILYQSLCQLATSIRQGRNDFSQLTFETITTLRAAKLEPEYVEIRCARTLSIPSTRQFPLVALAAVQLGKARLIDNVLIDSP